MVQHKRNRAPSTRQASDASRWVATAEPVARAMAQIVRRLSPHVDVEIRVVPERQTIEIRGLVGSLRAYETMEFLARNCRAVRIANLLGIRIA